MLLAGIALPSLALSLLASQALWATTTEESFKRDPAAASFWQRMPMTVTEVSRLENTSDGSMVFLSSSQVGRNNALPNEPASQHLSEIAEIGKDNESSYLYTELKIIQVTLENEWQSLMLRANEKYNDDDSASPSFREVPNVLPHRNNTARTNSTNPSSFTSAFDVTLTTFVSNMSQQLDLVPNLASQWKGPLSVAVYMDCLADIATFLSFYHDNMGTTRLANTTFHILLEKVAVSGEMPPDNRLRNLAMGNAPSEYCLVMDVEFVPSAGMYENLMASLRDNYRVKAVLNEFRLLALPAFESTNTTTRETIALSEMPRDKHELVKRLREGSVVLAPMPNISIVARAMDFDKWKRPVPGVMYVCDWIRGYHPFVLARRQGLPLFWPGFRSATSYAKQSWFEELYERYFTIGVLRAYFAFRVRGSPLAIAQTTQEEIKEYRRFRQYVHETYVQDPTLKTKLEFQYATSVASCNASALPTTESSSLAFFEVEQAIQCEWQAFSSSSDYRRQYPRVLPVNLGKDNAHLLALALHGSVDRLDRLVIGIQRWMGPVSVAVYVTSHESISRFFLFYRRHSPHLANVVFHFFFEKIIDDEKDKLYPHNYLRNLASDYSDTKYIIVCDMDFVTSQDAYPQLHRLLQRKNMLTMGLDNRTVFVLPAFENSKSATGKDVTLAPKTKTELVEAVLEKKVAEPFHMRKYAAGHGPTNFTKWFRTDISPTYDIVYVWGFEPYVLARRDGLPRFWTAFRGFGFNKQSWCEEVSQMGYKFSVLRDFFVFHMGESSGMVNTPAWVHDEYQRIFRPRLDRLYPFGR